MLIGAHVSPAGGPAKAVERGVERGCRAIQIFNQNPRAWRPREYSDEEVAAYHEAVGGSDIGALLIHAVYLLNCASEDKEIRDKSLTALIAALRVGDALGAHAVILHPGSAKAGEVAPAIKRAGTTIKRALAQTGGCPLHLENTAGAGGTLGRSFTELAELLDAAGGDRRLGICLDSCHLYASGFDVRTADDLAAVIDDCVAQVGLDRLGSLHYNDSQTPLGSNRDHHANVGEGELGDDGAAVWFSEPRFEGLPCVLETQGPDKSGPSAAEVARAVSLRERGLRDRA
ncbi:MAG TPA: deoxyribonuclease IV [Solirubrobacteraceae bacterium]|jgi:deoxyribonuclease-4